MLFLLPGTGQKGNGHKKRAEWQLNVSRLLKVSQRDLLGPSFSGTPIVSLSLTSAVTMAARKTW